MTNWPDYFPLSCPPPSAQRDDLQVYRLVSVNPPTAADFLPTIIEQPHRPFPPESLCIACGVSVYRKLEDALRTKERYPKLQDKKIAIGQITSSDGLVMPTGGASHISWWLQTRSPEATFQEVPMP